MPSFVGRQRELAKLKTLLRKKSANFVVMRGRRRIGKSRLIREFGELMPSYILSGLPITEATTRQSQLDEFASQLSRLFGTPRLTLKDWGEAFWHLGKLTEKGGVLIALDEISWIGSKHPDFLGQLKNAWDLYFSRNPKLILIVCGSVSSWIHRNILSSSGFLGRISLDMQIEELPLPYAAQFWDGRRDRINPYEILKILAVTGGVPRYLEDVVPGHSAEQNIHDLCFDREGLLFREFDQIFSDLFCQRAPLYTEIVKILSHQPRDLPEICNALNMDKSGVISSYLKDLRMAGFIAEDPTWNIATGKISQLKKFRLSDNYLRFYVRYILPNRKKIEKKLFQAPAHSSLPGWEAMMGLQFENLVLANSSILFEILDLPLAELSMAGPYFQRQTKRTSGCQIDLLIQMRHRTLYLCEIKFRADKVGIDTIYEMEEKRRRLVTPKGWSVRQVLIHVNGVTQPVLESESLDRIVDFSELIVPSH